MKDAFEILGVPPDADEARIRESYLRLVREFPPDRNPERFAEIRAAFDDLRNPLARIERKLFSLQTGDSLRAIDSDLRTRLLQARLPVNDLLGLTKLR